MDRANYALAARLASTGHEVHLVAHRVAASLRQCGAIVHAAPRPANSHAVGMPLLAREARRRAAQLRSRDPYVVANGGNCALRSINWVHYVHAAYDPARDAAASGMIARLERRYVLRHERRALSYASLIICNSERTRRDVVDRLGVPEARAHVVQYGTDPSLFAPPPPQSRAAARAALGVTDGRPVVLFVGALGDRRKGFDALFEGWSVLSRRGWNAELFVAGEGRELAAWRARAEQAGLGGQMHFLGFRDDVHVLLAAADVLVHPARYEAYGLAVHEAICAGVAAIVSARAGVAEQYPASLRALLLPEVSGDAIAVTLDAWRGDRATFAAAAAATGALWRARTWNHMADEIVALVTRP
jgi:glycosyltransferase involved in cell wall biosynthesis